MQRSSTGERCDGGFGFIQRGQGGCISAQWAARGTTTEDHYMKPGQKAEAMSKTGSETEARFLDAKMDLIVSRSVCTTCPASSLARG